MSEQGNAANGLDWILEYVPSALIEDRRIEHRAVYVHLHRDLFRQPSWFVRSVIAHELGHVQGRHEEVVRAYGAVWAVMVFAGLPFAVRPFLLLATPFLLSRWAERDADGRASKVAPVACALRGPTPDMWTYWRGRVARALRFRQRDHCATVNNMR